MQAYLDFLRHIRDFGVEKPDRTGVGIKSVFGYQMRFDLREGFPLVTTKKLSLRSIIHELLWFLKGETHLNYLHNHQVTIWDEWADADGNLGPIYGKQWRSWQTEKGETIDQITNVIQQIKTDPYSRRLVVSAWNVGELSKMRPSRNDSDFARRRSLRLWASRSSRSIAGISRRRLSFIK